MSGNLVMRPSELLEQRIPKSNWTFYTDPTLDEEHLIKYLLVEVTNMISPLERWEYLRWLVLRYGVDGEEEEPWTTQEMEFREPSF